MLLRQRATVKTPFIVSKLHPFPAKTGTRRLLSGVNEGFQSSQETRSQYAAVSPNPETRSRDRIRILCIDGHPLFREGIARIINEQPDMVLVSEASIVQEAIQLYREHQPDITLMEIQLPDWNGIDALSAIRSEFPTARIIILTASDGDVEVRRALNAGASGYLLKDTPPSELLQEIRKVHSGRRAIQPQLAAKLAEHIGDDTLSTREVGVLALVAQGNRNRDIGTQLCISVETVKAHLKHIREKLGAKDRTEAIAIAVRRGILRL
jgi:DNA-binding NarL/FixJ family response regulator